MQAQSIIRFILCLLAIEAGIFAASSSAFAQTRFTPPQGQSCKDKPPVILIHGTFANFGRTFSTLNPLLQSRGYCVFGINYGAVPELPRVYATGDMGRSAEEVAQFVRQVLFETGQAKAILVGHSQGGTLAFYMTKHLGLAQQIDRMVAIAPSVRGTRVAMLAPPQSPCLACIQQSSESAFIKSLAEGGLNPHGLKTLVMATENDRIVVPWQMQFIDEPMVENVLFQREVSNVQASHSGIMRNPDAMRFVADWLDRP